MRIFGHTRTVLVAVIACAWWHPTQQKSIVHTTNTLVVAVCRVRCGDKTIGNNFASTTNDAHQMQFHWRRIIIFFLLADRRLLDAIKWCLNCVSFNAVVWFSWVCCVYCTCARACHSFVEINVARREIHKLAVWRETYS